MFRCRRSGVEGLLLRESMNKVKFLYGSDGDRVLAELPYDEYVRLTDSLREAPLLRARMKQISDMLESQLSGADAPDTQHVETAAPVSAVAVAVRTVVPDAEVPPVAPVAARPVESVLLQKIPAVAAAPSILPKEDRAVAIPVLLLEFLTQQDPSQNSLRLIETCARKLSGLCGKRITLSLHKPYICLWDFDEWKTFAFGEVMNGSLYLSIEKSLVPETGSSDVWTPPGGLYKKPLVRLKVDAVTDTLLAHLKNALTCKIESAPA